jgi:cytochrome c biogenesis protein CcmG/thiol:disulfide interchange protein DsbE
MIDIVGLKYPNWIDMDGKALVDWGVTGAPETFFIDSKGIVRAKIIGLLTEESLLENINLIIGEEN